MAGELESDSKEEAYLDRNLAVLALVKMALHRGFACGRGNWDETAEWVPIYIELPTGQVSWHVRVREIPPEVWNELRPVEWDGHNLEAKRARLRRFAERGY
jgi:hypothetical protein